MREKEDLDKYILCGRCTNQGDVCKRCEWPDTWCFPIRFAERPEKSEIESTAFAG